jgi:hypothetical protein
VGFFFTPKRKKRPNLGVFWESAFRRRILDPLFQCSRIIFRRISLKNWNPLEEAFQSIEHMHQSTMHRCSMRVPLKKV